MEHLACSDVLCCVCEQFCWLANQFGQNLAACEQRREKTATRSCRRTWVFSVIHTCAIIGYKPITGTIICLREEKLFVALCEVLDRCGRGAVKWNPALAVAVAVAGLTIPACPTCRGGAARTNMPQVGTTGWLQRGQDERSWRRCVTRGSEHRRSSQEDSWCVRRLRRMNIRFKKVVLWPEFDQNVFRIYTSDLWTGCQQRFCCSSLMLDQGGALARAHCQRRNDSY